MSIDTDDLTADRLAEIRRKPFREALAEMQSLGLLPERTTETPWAPEAGKEEPPRATSAFISRLDANKPFTSGKSSVAAWGPLWWTTGGTQPSVAVESLQGESDALWFDFVNLGANRQCIVWVDLRVFSPAGSSVTFGASGNPSTTVVTYNATGGQRHWIAFALKADASGRGMAYMVPTLTGHGAAWYATEIYGV